MDSTFRTRGADPNIESFYTTEYASAYQRPRTTTTRSVGLPRPTATPVSGFASNNHVSPLELAPLEDREIYQQTTTHATHAPACTLRSLMAEKPVARAAMERSGYWTEPEPNVLYDSPQARRENEKTREINASYLPPQTLRNLRQHNPVEAENGGAGPKWGSTTSGTAYSSHESSHDRYWKMNRSLIGRREGDGFSRQHLTISEKPIDEQTSIAHSSYRPPPRSRGINIPNRSVIERSGFTDAMIPTHTHPVQMCEHTVDQLHPIEVQRMKHVNTTEYQNLFNPDPWMSVSQISYQNPNASRSRALTAAAPVRRGNSGYGVNETVHAGAPGDARTFKTGKTDTMKKFKDPELGFKGFVQRTPNVVERSGYWANSSSSPFC